MHDQFHYKIPLFHRKSIQNLVVFLSIFFAAFSTSHANPPNVTNPTPEQVLRWNLFTQYLHPGIEDQLAIINAPASMCETVDTGSQSLLACHYGQIICETMKTITNDASAAATNLIPFAPPGMTRTEILLALGTGESALTTLLGDYSSREVIWKSVSNQWSNALCAAALELPTDSAPLEAYQDALTQSCNQHLICERLDCLGNAIWEDSYKDFTPMRRTEAIQLYSVLGSILTTYYAHGEDLPRLLTDFGSPPFEECQNNPQILLDAFSHFVCIGKNHTEMNAKGYAVDVEALIEAARAYRADVAEKARFLTGTAHFYPSRPELAPLDGINPNAPRFSWSRSSCTDCGRVNYRLELWKGDQIISLQEGIEETSFRLNQNLEAGSEYRWAVSAVSEYGLETSSDFMYVLQTGPKTEAGMEPGVSLKIYGKNHHDDNWTLCKDASESNPGGQAPCMGTTVSSFRIHAGDSTCENADCSNRYSINWGDAVGFSSFSETANVEHIYKKPGLYDVTLVVRDDHNRQSAAMHWPILVLESPAGGGGLPSVRIIDGPDAKGAFTFQGNQLGGKITGYYCSFDDRQRIEGESLDFATFTEAASFGPTEVLREGSHTFFVRAASTDGKLSPVAAHSFVITYESKLRGRTPGTVTTPSGEEATFNVEIAYENRGTLAYDNQPSGSGYVELHAVDLDGEPFQSLIYPGDGEWLGNGKIRVTTRDGIDPGTGQSLFRFSGKISSTVSPGVYPACFRLYKPYGAPGAAEDGLYFGEISCLSLFVVVPPQEVQSLPLQPDSLSASLDETGEVRLRWHDQADNEDGFKLARKLKGDSQWDLIATIPSKACEPGGWQCYTDQTELMGHRSYVYLVQAYNYVGDSPSVEVEIYLPNHAPQFLTATALPFATRGEAYLFKLKAEDQDLDPLTFSAITLPHRMILSAKGILSWIPMKEDIGEQSLIVRVSDGKNMAEAALTLTVFDRNIPPRITSSFPINSDLLDLKPNEETTFRVTAEDPDDDSSLSIQWYVNETLAGTGNNYSFHSQSGAFYLIEARIVDDGGLSASRFWSVRVRKHTISVLDGPHGIVIPSGSLEAMSGQTYRFTAQPDSCYEVREVLIDGDSKGAVSSWDLTAAGDHIVAVTFKPISPYIEPYVVTSEAGWSGKVEPLGRFCVDHGNSITFKINPDPCHHIYRVLVDGNDTEIKTSYTLKVDSRDRRFWASFKPDVFTVEVSAEEHGKIEPSGELSAECGDNRTIVIIPDEYYVVQNVEVDGKWVGPIRKYRLNAISADHSITAYFKPDAPLAEAGPDQTVPGNGLVVLNAVNTTDSGVGIKSLQWAPTVPIEIDWQPCKNPTPSQVCFKAPDLESSSLVFELTATDNNGFSTKDACIVNVSMTNTTPVAKAGVNQTVHQGKLVMLDGSKSSDSDGSILAYNWTQLSGTPAPLANAREAVTTFWAPEIGIEGGALIFLLSVEDNQGLRAVDRCIVNITTGNQPPIANAGLNQIVNEKDLVTLDGLGSSDPDGPIISRRWRQLSGTPVRLNSPQISRPAFYAPPIRRVTETLTFELSVTDDKGLQSARTCDVKVKKCYDSLSVDLSPQEAVDAGAKWKVVIKAGDTIVGKTTWKSSGEIVENLDMRDPNTISFGYVAGYISPPDQQVKIESGRIVPAKAVYKPRVGSLTVMLSPQEAVTTGARWRVNGGSWMESGQTVSNLSTLLAHHIEYHQILGWTPPEPRDVTVWDGKIKTFYGTYTLQRGPIQVNLSPPEAIAAGALWQADVRPWLKSGEKQDGLSVLTNHTINFKGIDGWTKPAAQVVSVEYGKTKVINAAYQIKSGLLKVTIMPEETVTAGARWRVNGGSWMESGQTVSNLNTLLAHHIEYNQILGWTPPEPRDVTVWDGKVKTFYGTYTLQRGSIQVNLSPPEAIAAGALWQADTRPWLRSGEKQDGLSVLTTHTINFKGIDGWTKPAAQVVSVEYGKTKVINAAYQIISGLLKVTIMPEEAARAGAKWRVNGGPLRASGETAAEIRPGSNIIAFSSLQGWIKPADLPVEISTDIPQRHLHAIYLPILKVSEPDGGEVWRRATQQHVQWVHTGQPAGSQVELELLHADGSLLLAQGVPSGDGGGGAFLWAVPANIELRADYRVRVRLTRPDGQTFADLSDAPFTIERQVASSAGPDQWVSGGVEVSLSGSNSLGVNELILSGEWKQAAGTPVFVRDPQSLQTSFDAPEVDAGGESFLFELATTGTDGQVSKDSCIVNVTDQNRPPVANAGVNQTVASFEWFTLDGSNSVDSDDGIAFYWWEQIDGPTVDLIQPSAAQAICMAPQAGLEGLALTFQLTLTDFGGLKARDSTIVNVLTSNAPPTAEVGSDLSVHAGEKVVLDGSKSFDPEGAVVSYEWKQISGPPVEVTGLATQSISFVAPSHIGRDPRIVFRLTVTDSGGLKGSDTVMISVK
jgi:PKD repeat protein